MRRLLLVDLCAQQTGGTDEARVLAKKMSDALVAFARTGNPSHSGIPRWPAFTAEVGETMIFDDQVVVRNVLTATCAAWCSPPDRCSRGAAHRQHATGEREVRRHG